MKRFITLVILAMAMLAMSSITASAQYIGADRSLRGQSFSFDKNYPPIDLQYDEIWALYGKPLDDEQLSNLLGEQEFKYFKNNRSVYRAGVVCERIGLITMLIGGAALLYTSTEGVIGTKGLDWTTPELQVGIWGFAGGAVFTMLTAMPLKEISTKAMKNIIKRYNKDVPITRLDIGATKNGIGLTMRF